MFGDTPTLGQTIVVCVFSMVVVFIVLLIISYVIDLTAYIVNRPGGKTTGKKPAGATSQPVQCDDSVNAVLAAAAVAAYLGKGTDQFVVRSIRRVKNEETPWIEAGRTGFIQ